MLITVLLLVNYKIRIFLEDSVEKLLFIVP